MSLSLNQVTLAGNLTGDPQLRHTQRGTAVAQASIAINRRWRDADSGDTHEETTYINDITFWGRTAENLCQYFTKGDPIFIQGRLRLDTWDDRETGKKRYRLTVVGANWQFLKSRSQRQQTQEQSESQIHEHEQQSQPQQQQQQPAKQGGCFSAATSQAQAGFAIPQLPEDEDNNIPF